MSCDRGVGLHLSAIPIIHMMVRSKGSCSPKNLWRYLAHPFWARAPLLGNWHCRQWPLSLYINSFVKLVEFFWGRNQFIFSHLPGMCKPIKAARELSRADGKIFQESFIPSFATSQKRLDSACKQHICKPRGRFPDRRVRLIWHPRCEFRCRLRCVPIQMCFFPKQKFD